MCQIHLIKKLNNSYLNENDFKEFCNLMVFGSINNKDAFGLFNENSLFFKQKGMFNLKGINKFNILNKSSFLVGHNRFTTSGTQDNNFNNHPFNLNNFIMVHNGVISNSDKLREKFNIDSKIKTDSYIILCLINHFYNKCNTNNEIKKVKYAIKKTTECLDGYYSIFLFNKNDKSLFYFKDSRADIEFILYDKSILIASTDKDNLKYSYCDDKYIVNEDKIKILDIQEEKIYLINQNGIKEIGCFKDGLLKEKYKQEDKIDAIIKQYENDCGNYNGYNGFNNSDYNYFKEKTEEKTDNNIKDDIDLIFFEKLSYIPEYKIENNKVIMLDEEFIKVTKYISNKYHFENNKVIYDIDDLINDNLEIVHS